MLTFTYVVAHNYIIAPLFSLTPPRSPPDMWELLKLGVGGYITGARVEKSVRPGRTRESRMDQIAFDLAVKLASFVRYSRDHLRGLVLQRESHERTLQSYREDTLRQQKIFQEGLAEVRRMYEDNVELVKGLRNLASDQKDVLHHECAGICET